MTNTTKKEKIRLFYELTNYFLKTIGDNYDNNLENLFNNIKNIVDDINNL